ncbi:hypothetical protein OIDMADRAFT_75519, partial [Oidiodendron maius Zn]
SLLVVNVYNAPSDATYAGETARALTLLPPHLFSQPALVAGDLNLRHPRWQPSLNRGQSTFADQFIAWLDNTHLVLTSQPDCPTHNLGNVLDLTFISGPLALAGATSVVAYDLDVTSDHRPLLSTIPWDQRYYKPPCRLRFNTLDKPLFNTLLGGNL